MYTSTEPHNLGVENSITTGSDIGWVRIGGDRMALRCCMLEKKIVSTPAAPYIEPITIGS